MVNHISLWSAIYSHASSQPSGPVAHMIFGIQETLLSRGWLSDLMWETLGREIARCSSCTQCGGSRVNSQSFTWGSEPHHRPRYAAQRCCRRLFGWWWLVCLVAVWVPLRARFVAASDVCCSGCLMKHMSACSHQRVPQPQNSLLLIGWKGLCVNISL